MPDAHKYADEELEARMQAEYVKYAEASKAVTYLSLIMLARDARKAAPDAKIIRMEWSDQGDFLNILGLRTSDDGDDTEINERQDVEDWRDDSTHLAWNLAGDCKSVWEPYAPDNDGSTFDFLIDDLLAIPLD